MTANESNTGGEKRVVEEAPFSGETELLSFKVPAEWKDAVRREAYRRSVPGDQLSMSEVARAILASSLVVNEEGDVEVSLEE